MRTLSWILLTIITVLGMLGSVGSLSIAYFGDPENDMITETNSLESLSLSPDAVKALQGRRGTAAALGLGFSVLTLFVVLGPYRKGAVWAWWAILCSTAIFGVVVLLRIVAIGTTQGAMTAAFVLLVAVPALLLDAGRLSGPPAADK